MSERFNQKNVPLRRRESTNRLKVSKLMSLLDDHPHLENVKKAFKVDEISEEYISIDNIDLVYENIETLFKNFGRLNVRAFVKDISLEEDYGVEIDGISKTPIKFVFDECWDDDDELISDLHAYAIHDSKNTYLGQYDMAKYANRLYDDGHYSLVKHNIDHFRKIAQNNPKKDKLKSYRLLKNRGELFVRGITSTDQYNEYGVDFTFVISMLTFHKLMKDVEGNNYTISSLAVSASKLELIITDKFSKQDEVFGEVSSSTIVSTNDLGNGSLKFLNVVKVGIENQRGIYLFPDAKTYENSLTISHSTGPDKVFEGLSQSMSIFSSSNKFIDELKNVRLIKTPDELRFSILTRIDSPNSSFRDITSLKDIFKPKISSEISNFVYLLEMCRKAEELDIDYDLKDKLRYIISDIILHKSQAS